MDNSVKPIKIMAESQYFSNNEIMIQNQADISNDIQINKTETTAKKRTMRLRSNTIDCDT